MFGTSLKNVLRKQFQVAVESKLIDLWKVVLAQLASSSDSRVITALNNTENVY